MSRSQQAIAGGTGTAGINAPDGRGIDVALVDSGVVPVGSLAERGRVAYGPDFSAERRDDDLRNLDTFGHGTHLAGLIAGRDPVTGFAGVAPGARLVSLKIAGADGETNLARVLAALDWIRRNHDAPGYNIRVVNLSLGVTSDDYRSDALAWAVEQLWNEGIVVVAAAGNNGVFARTLDMPADDPFVIAAGASDTRSTFDARDDRVADFSSRSRFRTPDIVAPGTLMVSLRVPGSTLDSEFSGARVGTKFFRGSGTSQAAAVTSGLAARLIAARPWLNPDQVKAMLMDGAVDLPDPRSADGAGRVDLRRTLALPTPDAWAVKQRWEPAVLDLRKLERELDDDDEALGPGAQWNGRRWSGRRWSGRRWSGAKWIADSDD
ncbi:MAG TPA: S8 family serine peptidase [Solirubrobacteraceae bacterium]|nr:S8 family serine peptidase [Solirubrobacteraceae bacterium]